MAVLLVLRVGTGVTLKMLSKPESSVPSSAIIRVLWEMGVRLLLIKKFINNWDIEAFTMDFQRFVAEQLLAMPQASCVGKHLKNISKFFYQI